MSEAPDLSEDEVLAAEHVLGVLTAAERGEAELRAAREPAFATLIEAWRARLAPLFAGIPAVTAPGGLWPRIERRLPANDNPVAVRRLRFWRGATVAALSLAAASLAIAVMVASRPPVTVLQPAPQQPAGALMSASLATPKGGALFVAAYDPDRKALLVTSLVPPGTDPDHDHELWLIPSDGKPRSLGLLAPGASKAMPMPEAMLPMMEEGSALAVSVEPHGGSKLDGPSGPIAAVGKLQKI